MPLKEQGCLLQGGNRSLARTALGRWPLAQKTISATAAENDSSFSLVRHRRCPCCTGEGECRAQAAMQRLWAAAEVSKVAAAAPPLPSPAAADRLPMKPAHSAPQPLAAAAITATPAPGSKRVLGGGTVQVRAFWASLRVCLAPAP
jgi:hypothetical protein